MRTAGISGAGIAGDMGSMEDEAPEEGSPIEGGMDTGADPTAGGDAGDAGNTGVTV